MYVVYIHRYGPQCKMKMFVNIGELKPTRLCKENALYAQLGGYSHKD